MLPVLSFERFLPSTSEYVPRLFATVSFVVDISLALFYSLFWPSQVQLATN